MFIRFFTLLLLTFLPIFAFSQIENPTNGIDDDGDGLIDCFDSDVSCTAACVDFYFQPCQIPCTWLPPCDTITLGVQYMSSTDVGSYPVMVAGDLDGDGMPEIVVPRSEGYTLSVLDGATGNLKYQYLSPVMWGGGTAPAIGDVDLDGFAEVFIVGKDRKIYCFSYNLTLKWVSPGLVGYDVGFELSTVNLANVDQLGAPEIVIGNQVFSSSNGALLASGGVGLSRGEHPARAGSTSFNSVVVVDALPDAFCADCAGLEIVAGNQVLSINLIAGTVKKQVQAAPGYSDGYTSVADFDNDGDLDAIVSGRRNGWNHSYVWEMETQTILQFYKLPNNYGGGASRMNVGNYDNDPGLEVSFISEPTLYCLDNNFTPKWTIPIVDASSVTCSSLFDFCGDGTVDVVYRSGEKLMVVEGTNGQIKWQTPCISATHIENPLILDVDNDGEAEIVTTCGISATDISAEGHVICYSPLNTPGIAARKVWNQHSYFVTNVNDDLSIPVVQQNPHLVGNGQVLNGFMNQYFDYRFPSPDAILTLESQLCDGDSLEVSFKICNEGYRKMNAATPISFYQKNPTTAANSVFLGTIFTNATLEIGSCETVMLKIPAIYNDSIFIIVNDNGSKPRPFVLDVDFPSTTVGECRFYNNMVGFYQKYTPAILFLGQDTAICDNGLTVLRASGDDYVAWNWQNSSSNPNFTATDAGVFWVEITDVCGFLQRDTIEIFVDSSTVVQLGGDREICAGDDFQLSQLGFDQYSWSPSPWANCNSCASPTFRPTGTGKITLQATFNNGCFSRDTLLVTVRDTFFQKIDTTICFGRTVVFNGVEIEPDAQNTFPFQSQFGCDSTIRVEVRGTKIGTYDLKIDSANCLGNPLVFNGLPILSNQFLVFKLKTYLGCDSTVTVKNVPLDTFFTEEMRSICPGTSTDIFGQNISQPGNYKKIFGAKNGCDSTHLVRLTWFPSPIISFSSAESCPNEPTGRLTATATGSDGPYLFDWAWPNAANAPVLNEIPAGNYPITVTDAAGCTTVATGNVGSFPNINFEIKAINPLCFDQKNGKISIKSNDSTLVWSLDGQLFGQDTLFQNLSSGQFIVVAEDIFGCTATQNLTLTNPPELLVKLPDDNLIKMGESLLLDIQTNSTDSMKYAWVPPLWLDCFDCPAPTARPFASVRWTLQITDPNGCTASDQMLLEVDQSLDIFMPNILKVNGLAENSQFQIYTGTQVKRIVLIQIFDRWGGLMYAQKDILAGINSAFWDGKMGDKFVASGVYVVQVQLELVDGNRIEVHGDLTVIR